MSRKRALIISKSNKNVIDKTPHNLTSFNGTTINGVNFYLSQSSNLDYDNRYAWKAMDGELYEEGGESHTDREWYEDVFFQIDFEKLVKVTHIIFTWRDNDTDAEEEEQFNIFNIEYLNSNNSWETALSDVEVDKHACAITEFDIPDDIFSKTWRIRPSENGISDGYLIIGEIEFTLLS